MKEKEKEEMATSLYAISIVARKWARQLLKEEVKESIDIEEVRHILASKSRDGFTNLWSD